MWSSTKKEVRQESFKLKQESLVNRVLINLAIFLVLTGITIWVIENATKHEQRRYEKGVVIKIDHTSEYYTGVPLRRLDERWDIKIGFKGSENLINVYDEKTVQSLKVNDSVEILCIYTDYRKPFSVSIIDVDSVSISGNWFHAFKAQ